MTKNEHILTCLGEEAVEIAKDVSKILRFGLHDVNVLHPTGPDNQHRLITELNDLLAVVEILIDRGLLPREWQSEDMQLEKTNKIHEFLQYARKKGRVH